MSLLPGSFHEEIKVSLKIVKLTGKESPKYQALSYTWGSTDDPSEISIVETQNEGFTGSWGRLAVTHNLGVALRYLRSEAATRDIWIDAICVDQENLEERGHQVELMGDIYQGATRVLIWLGPESQDSPLAIETLRSLSSRFEVDWQTQSVRPLIPADKEKDRPTGQLGIVYDEATWLSILNFLRRAWFQRLWIWQEVLLAGRAEMQCGYETLDWNAFRKAVVALHTEEPPAFSSHDDHAHYKQSLYHMYRLSSMNAHRGSFLQWAEDTEKCRYTDPRDRIYALLNILREVDPIRGLKPNYTQLPYDVFKDVVLRWLDRNRELEFLGSCDSSEDAVSTRPSWVPDWCKPAASNRIIDAGASYGTKAKAQHMDDGLLQVCGVLAGKVSNTEPHLVGGNIHHSRITRSSIVDLVHKLSNHIRHHRPHATDSEIINHFCQTMCMNKFAGSFSPPVPFHPSLEEGIAYITGLLHHSSGALPKPPYNFLNQMGQFAKGRCFITTDDGLMGLAPEAAKAGDQVCVVLGCHTPLLIRLNEKNGRYTMIGECYIHSLMASEALLGPLPSEWTNAAIRIEGFAYVLGFVNSANSEEHLFEDPRLGSVPEGWKLKRPEEKPHWSNWYVNDETGERLVWPCDPRMTPDELAARGIQIQEIVLE
ncbi:MAG: hypothetical protein Q9220_003890 [cf. Caloplaca sp. 1 TL-2023]